jgi:hypothetical protein
MSRNIPVVKGVATYFANNNDGSFEVLMNDTDDFCSCVKVCASMESAVMAADRLQEKENKAIKKVLTKQK